MAVPEVAGQRLAAWTKGRLRLCVLIVKSGARVWGYEGVVELKVASREIMKFKINATSLEGSGIEGAEDLAGDAVGDVWDELEGVVEGANDEAVVTIRGEVSKCIQRIRQESAYKVKGPLTRSKRTLPVLMMIKRGTSARDSLTTVAAKAVCNRPKILPSAPKGLQDWQ